MRFSEVFMHRIIQPVNVVDNLVRPIARSKALGLKSLVFSLVKDVGLV